MLLWDCFLQAVAPITRFARLQLYIYIYIAAAIAGAGVAGATVAICCRWCCCWRLYVGTPSASGVSHVDACRVKKHSRFPWPVLVFGDYEVSPFA